MPTAANLPDDDRLGYRPDELPRLLTVSRSEAYRLAREIGVRNGRRIIVPRENLETWLRGLPRANKGKGAS